MNNQQQNNQNAPGRDQLTNETEDISNKNADSNAVYLNNSSLQIPAEFEQDKKSDQTKQGNSSTSSVDDLESNSGGLAGTDRAGTAERKAYGDVELNKGLESQAKDEESQFNSLDGKEGTKSAFFILS